MAHARSVVRLGPQEMAMLKALAGGHPVRIPSFQRLRLEMLGLARDGPGGFQVTSEGRALLWRAPVEFQAEHADAVAVKRDVLGRRRGNQRSIP